MLGVLMRTCVWYFWAIWRPVEYLCTREQWWALVFSPKRACLA